MGADQMLFAYFRNSPYFWCVLAALMKRFASYFGNVV
jgi:hypothetical protein